MNVGHNHKIKQAVLIFGRIMNVQIFNFDFKVIFSENIEEFLLFQNQTIRQYLC